MLGLGTSLVKGGMAGRQYVKDGLKLYMPYKGADTNKGVQFVGEGSTAFVEASSHKITVADDDSLDVRSITITAWIKPTNFTSENVVITKTYGTSWEFGTNSSQGDIHLNANINDAYLPHIVNGGSPCTLNIWNHISLTYDKTLNIIKTYLNGVLNETVTSATIGAGDGTGLGINTDDLFIGARTNNSLFFPGSMKNIAIWNRALTATEIQNVMYKQYDELPTSSRITDGLVSWWGLDVDYTDSHGDNDGTNSGSTLDTDLYGSDTPVKPRAIDNAPTVQADAIGSGSALFVASNTDYINVGNSSSLQITGTAITVTSWVNILTDTDWMKIISNSTGGSYTDGYTFFYSNEQFHFSINHETANVAKVAYTTYGEWHHLTGVYDGTNIKIYVDGVLEGTNTSSIPAAIDNDDVKLFIGSEEDLELDFTGYICNVGIWSAALTQAQIKSIMWKNYAGLTSSETTNLVSWWNLDEADGSTVEDLHGSNDGTLT
jgi:hypothetical protein